MPEIRGLQTTDYERRLLAKAIENPFIIRMDRIEIAARHLPTITQLLADYDVLRSAHASAAARAEAAEARVAELEAQVAQLREIVAGWHAIHSRFKFRGGAYPMVVEEAEYLLSCSASALAATAPSNDVPSPAPAGSPAAGVGQTSPAAGVLSVPEDRVQEFRAQWDRQIQGVDHRWETPIVRGADDGYELVEEAS